MPAWKRAPRARDAAEFEAKRNRQDMVSVRQFEHGHPIHAFARAHRRLLLAASVLVLASILVLAVYVQPWNASQAPPYAMVPPDSRFTGGQLIQGPIMHPLVFNGCTGDYRPDYGLSCDAQKAMFARLPQVNKDLVDVANTTFWGMINGGNVNLGALPATYWQQPEFYPSWRWESTVRNMTVQDSAWWTPYGFGMYPGITAFNISQAAAGGKPVVLDAFAFFHADFNVSTWQGVDVYPTFPTDAISANGSTVFTQDPAQARAAIALSIQTANDSRYDALRTQSGFSTNLPLDGRFFLLGPTHDNLTTGPTQDCALCSPWTVRLDIRFTVSTAQKGSYVVALATMNPGAWVNEQFGSPTGTYRIGSYYVASGDWHGGYLLQMILSVT